MNSKACSSTNWNYAHVRAMRGARASREPALENSKHPLLNVRMVSHPGEDGFYSSHFSFSTEVTHFHRNVVFL